MDNILGITTHPFFANKTIKAITPLTGGLNNPVYQVTLSDETVIVRINPHLSTHLSTHLNHSDENQSTELALQTAIAAIGYAPQILAQSAKLTIMEYIEGSHQPARDWSEIALDNFAQQLATIHQLNPAHLPNTPLHQQISDYQQQLNLTTSELLLVNTSVQQLAKLAELPSTMGLCHQDLNPGNIIASVGRQMIIDWEFAAKADVFFDLASFTLEHQLNSATTERFITTYLSYQSFNLNAEQREQKLQLMTIAYSLVCWLWHKTQLMDDSEGNSEEIQQIHQQRMAVYYQWLITSLGTS